MKNIIVVFLILFVLVNLSGCVPLIVGGALGVVGGYAVSKDTVQGETDTDYNKLWDTALTVSGYRGVIRSQDIISGYLYLEAESSKVYIHLTRVTKLTTRLRVSARKHHFPNLTLAEEIFVKIMEEAKR